MLNAPGAFGGNDLYTRYGELHRWFAGLPVYTHPRHAGYPPASYVLFWPLIGWLPWAGVRWLWTLLNLGTLALGMRALLKHGSLESPREQALLALLLLSPYPLAVTLGNGQLGVLILTSLLAALFVLERPPTWRRDLLAAALLLFATIKPSLIVPFLLVGALRPSRRLRPMIMLGVGYVALTALAMSFRSQPFFVELAALARISSQVVVKVGHAHLPLWLGELGLGSWSGPASLVVLLGLGCWLTRQRGVGLWPVLGVSALIGRLASYHGVYDDSLVLIALVALYRDACRADAFSRRRAWARALLVLVSLTLLLPASLATMGPPFSILHHVLAPLVWLAAAVFLGWGARPEVGVGTRAQTEAPRSCQ